MANGSPVGALLASLLFGTSSATANTVQTVFSNAPTDFVLMIPYAVTVVGIVLISIINEVRANNKKKKKAQTSVK